MNRTDVVHVYNIYTYIATMLLIVLNKIDVVVFCLQTKVESWVLFYFEQ